MATKINAVEEPSKSRVSKHPLPAQKAGTKAPWCTFVGRPQKSSTLRWRASSTDMRCRSRCSSASSAALRASASSLKQGQGIINQARPRARCHGRSSPVPWARGWEGGRPEVLELLVPPQRVGPHPEAPLCARGLCREANGVSPPARRHVKLPGTRALAIVGTNARSQRGAHLDFGAFLECLHVGFPFSFSPLGRRVLNFFRVSPPRRHLVSQRGDFGSALLSGRQNKLGQRSGVGLAVAQHPQLRT